MELVKFIVYSKVLLSKRASGEWITEKNGENEKKLELCAYQANSLQEICDRRKKGKSLPVLCIQTE